MKFTRLQRLRALWRYLPRRSRRPILRESYRVVLLLVAAIAIDFAFPERPTSADLPVLEEGMVAAEDVIAALDFPVYKSESELARERAEAASSVSPVFELQSSVADTALSRLNTFFTALEQAVDANPEERARQEALRELLGARRIAASDAQMALLIDPESRKRLADGLRSAIDALLRDGAVGAGELGSVGSGRVIIRSDRSSSLVDRDSLVTMPEFYRRAAARVSSRLGVAGLQLYQKLLINFSQPTIRLDSDATAAARAQARRAVNPVKYEVLEGERIVAAHERVGFEQIEQLEAYESQMAQLGRTAGGSPLPANRIGSILFSLLLLTVYGLLLRFFRPEIYNSQRSVTLIWILILAVAGASGVIARTGVRMELIPIAFIALSLATLYDGLLALLTVFIVTALVVGRPPLLGMTALFSTLLAGSAAALSGRVVRRRAQTWSFAAVIAAAYLLAAISLGLLLQYDVGWVVSSTLWGSANAVGSTLLAMGILPIAESFTGITTDQTLLELADLNRPLLRRLSLEAPGTYAHSINVANLAEAAAREIDANSLLARVGIYYHDIGKLKKPQYFVENQPRGRNPHDKLKPATSANIVREHVQEGLELAEEAGLPEVVRQFVTQHHGTQRIGFFWEKVRELDPDGEHDLADYTYPGPKPQTRETAIALLADSVESAARALQDPTPEKITELVDRIVAKKMEEGQLDRAPLTLREVSLIKEQFVKVLTGMYHHRIDYPSPDEADRQPQGMVAREAG